MYPFGNWSCGVGSYNAFGAPWAPTIDCGFGFSGYAGYCAGLNPLRCPQALYGGGHEIF